MAPRTSGGRGSDSYTEYVKRIVDSAPPLSALQLVRLQELFRITKADLTQAKRLSAR